MASHQFTVATLARHEAWIKQYRDGGGRFTDIVKAAINLAASGTLTLTAVPSPNDGSDSSIRLDSEAVATLDRIRGLAPRLTFLRAAATAYMDTYPPTLSGDPIPSDADEDEIPVPEIPIAAPTATEE